MLSISIFVRTVLNGKRWRLPDDMGEMHMDCGVLSGFSCESGWMKKVKFAPESAIDTSHDAILTK